MVRRTNEKRERGTQPDTRNKLRMITWPFREGLAVPSSDRQNDIKVVAEAADGEEGLPSYMISFLPTSCLVLDLQMPGKKDALQVVH